MRYSVVGNTEIYKIEHKIFNKKEIILDSASLTTSYGGCITKGVAFLESIDNDGTRHILDMYIPGSVFISKTFLVDSIDSLYLTAKTKCEIDLFKSPIIGVSNIQDKKISFESIHIEAQKRALAHINIISQRTTRKKLMTLFKYLSDGKQQFKLQISLSDCSDFLSVDRSAMMRELKKMADEGLIVHNGRELKLLY